MAANKRQHFVPQFYLRQFSGGNPFIRCFNKKRRKVIARAPIKNQCAINNYYEWDERIEKSLGQIEGFASNLIRNVISNQSLANLSEEEFAFLLVFVAIQSGRTKTAGDANDAMTTHYMRMMGQGAPELKGIDLNDFEVRNTYPAALPLRAMISGADRLLSLGSCVLVNRSRVPFFCSDNPVIRYNSQASHVRHQGVVGLESPGLQVIFPLSPKVALYLYDQDVYSPPSNTGTRVIREEDAIRVAIVNYLWSDENIYLPDGCPDQLAYQLHDSLTEFSDFERLKIIESEPAAEPDGKIGSMIHQFQPHPPVELRFQFARILQRYDDDKYSRYAPKRDRPDGNSLGVISYKVKPYHMHEHVKGARLRRVEMDLARINRPG